MFQTGSCAHQVPYQLSPKFWFSDGSSESVAQIMAVKKKRAQGQITSLLNEVAATSKLLSAKCLVWLTIPLSHYSFVSNKFELNLFELSSVTVLHNLLAWSSLLTLLPMVHIPAARCAVPHHLYSDFLLFVLFLMLSHSKHPFQEKHLG